MAERVFIHIDGRGGSYPGNGGFLMLSLLANELARMGYAVALFDHADALTPARFDWMDLERRDFEIVPFAAVFDNDAPIITTWLRAWLDVLIAHDTLIPRLRYWCQDELLRTDSRLAREFVKAHIPRFAISNRDLWPHYAALGLTPTYVWSIWVRALFHPDAGRRVPQRIGYQPDRGGDERLDLLRARFGAGNVIECTGTQRDVAERLQTCDVFLHWNNPKNLVFEGEGFGLSLAEAAACGCACVTRAHPGNAWAWLHGEMLAAPSFDVAMAMTSALVFNQARKEQARSASLRAIHDRGGFSEADVRRYLNDYQN